MNAKQAMFELSFWLKDMSDPEAAEARQLLQSIVDHWMEQLSAADPKWKEQVYGGMVDGLNALRKGDPEERLSTLRFEAFKSRLNQTTFRAYLRAKQIVDGEAGHDEVEGKELLDRIDQLRKEAPLLDPGNKTAADFQLSEAFAEAHYIRRGGGMSMRLGNYLRTKQAQ